MTPFSTPALIVLDTVRSLIAFAGFALVGMYLVRRWPTIEGPRQMSRVLGMALALFTLALSRLTNLGGPMTWQLWASVLVFGLVAYSAMHDRRLSE